MKSKFIAYRLVVLITVILSSIGFGYIHQTRPGGIVIVVFLVATFFIPIVIFFLIRLAKTQGEFTNSWPGFICILLLAGLGSSLISWPAGKYFYEKNISESQTRLETFIPHLETYKSKNGYYPNSLTDLSLPDLDENLPSYLATNMLYKCQSIMLYQEDEVPSPRPIIDNFYHSNGEQFELCIDRQDLFDTLGTMSVYSSNDKRWGTRVAVGGWGIGEGR